LTGEKEETVSDMVGAAADENETDGELGRRNMCSGRRSGDDGGRMANTQVD